jgi:hypothetical protein
MFFKFAEELVKPYVCDVDGCGMAFAQKYKLKLHKDSVHDNVSFKCPGNPKYFAGNLQRFIDI